MTTLSTLVQNLIAFLSAGLGAFLAVSIGVSHRHLCALISFAAGTLFATTLIHIIPEAVESASLFAIAIALASGYFLFYLVSRYVFHVCPACAASHFEHAASEFQSIAILLAITLGLHSTMDGVAIALGREMGSRARLSIFLTITIHKFPEGLALSALLLRAGYDKMKSLIFTIVLESSTLIGWVLGTSFLRGFGDSRWFYLMLVHIGGGFVYLALHAVLNEAKEHSPRFIIFFFLTGIALISLTRWIPS